MATPKTRDVTAQSVVFHRPDGAELGGYLATPSNVNGAPAIVVIQEWWGLNDQIRGVADRLAAAGYLALVPDLYRGAVTVEEEEAHHLMSNLDFADAANQDILGAVQFLKARTQTVGITGFCMGGALTFLALSFIPQLAAGIVFYGMPPLDYLNLKAINVPVQAHWATQDEFFPIEQVGLLEEKLTEAGVDFEFHRYLAHHAFTNETAVGSGRIPGTQFDPVWAQLAWDRALTFFGRTLWG